MMLKKYVVLAASLAVLISLPWASAGLEQADRASSERAAPTPQPRVDQTPATDRVPATSNRREPGASGPTFQRPPDAALTPRRPYQKMPNERLALQPEESGRLIVKFRDEVRARASVEARGQLTSRAGRNVNPFRDIVEQFELTVVPAIQVPEERIAAIENRAAAMSSRAQPDLAGMVYVTGPRERMEQVARAINSLDIVEFVEIEPVYRLHGSPTGACCPPQGVCQPFFTEMECDFIGGTYLGDGTLCSPSSCVAGACCVGTTCSEVFEVECDQAGGTFWGIGTSCGAAGCNVGNCCIIEDCITNLGNQFECMASSGTFIGGMPCPVDPQDDDPCENFDCGEPGAGPCFMAHNTPYCDDDNCCDAVCDIIDFCCMEPFGEWDDICVALAHFVCTPQSGAHPCMSAFAGPCHESHSGRGCQQTDCCFAVCEVDPFCCNGFWNQNCAALANSICPQCHEEVETPDLLYLQGYLFEESYFDLPGGVPSGLYPPAPGFRGYGGEGFSLRDPLPEDHEFFDPYRGLYGLARELLEEYGVGQELVDAGVLHPTWGGGRGAGIKVGIVEWAYYENHEDLNATTVLPDGDQMIMIPDVSSPDHGTASIGIVSSVRNEFGITGMAPDAEAYFFPITSINQGPRPLTAIAEAIELFGPGDVLSFSWGPGPDNLNTRPSTHLMFTLASDSNITCVMSAGNDCYNLDDAEDLGDSGAIVVGAVSPGRPYDRMWWSNYYKDAGADELERSNIITISAWGSNVTSLGYGGLFWPDCDFDRSYTHTYNGTSAAAPQIAGLVACVQGLALQFYGIPVSNEKVRNAIRFEAWPQQEIPLPENRAGWEEQNNRACGPDVDPDEEVPNVVGFPRARSAGVYLLQQSGGGFDCNTELKQVHVVRGTHKHGNVFSARCLDGIYLIGESEETGSGSKPSNMVPEWRRQLNQVAYVTTGQIVDVMGVFQIPHHTVTQLQLFTAAAPTTTWTVSFLEIYDWESRSWIITDASVTEPGEPIVNANMPWFGAERFVRNSDRTILVRVWAFGMPLGSFDPTPVAEPFDFRLDIMNIEVTGFTDIE